MVSVIWLANRQANVWNVPAPVLRGIARSAGVHLYNEQGDVLTASRDLLAVHTLAGGKRELKLPAKVEVVYDLYCGRRVARGVDRFTVEMPPVSSALWYVGAEKPLALLEKN